MAATDLFEALRPGDALARTVFEASPLGMVVTDDRGRYVQVNRAFAALLGREPGELVGMHVREVTHPDDVRAGESARSRVEQDPAAVADFEKRFVRPDGGTVWVRLRVTAIRGPAGEDYRLGQAENITDRRLAETAAAQETARLRTTISVQREVTAAATDRESVLALVAERALAVLPSADGAVVELVEGGNLRYTATAGTLAGQRGVVIPIEGSLAGTSVTSRSTVHCEDVETDPRVNLAACRRTGIGSMLIAPLLAAGRPIGALKVSSRVPRAFDAADEQQLTLLADALTGALRHVDDAHRQASLLDQANRALSALRTSEERFRLVFDNCPLGMVLTSLREADNGTLLQVNTAMSAITGYPVERLVGMHADELLGPDDAMAGIAFTPELLQLRADDTRQAVRPLRHADGHVIWVRSHAAMVRDEAGTPVYLVSQLEDITGRRVIDEQLRERAQLLDLTQDAVVVRRLDGRVSYWNPAAERVYGWPAGAAVGQHLDRLLGTGWPDGANAASVSAALGRDGVWEGELGHRRADGRRVTVLSRQALQRNADGTPVAVLSINTDVTARRAAEQARDAAIADLADRNGELEAANGLKRDLIGMLGHEIGNPLGVILGYTQLLGDPDEDLSGDDVDAAVTAIGAGAHRLQAIVREILAQVTLDAGTLTATPETVPVAEHLRSALVAGAVEGVTVECRADLTASVQPQHLDQILANLLSNAAKYGGGATRLRAVPVDGGMVEIRVQDGGPGVPAEFRDQLFDRFARAEPTARTVQGTGLGLHIVRELARANGGDVGYRPAEDGERGAMFVITLPAR